MSKSDARPLFAMTEVVYMFLFAFGFSSVAVLAALAGNGVAALIFTSISFFFLICALSKHAG